MSSSPEVIRSRLVERSPVYYGWVVWVVATLGLIATSPGQSFSVSLFNDHFIDEFAMTRTDVSGLYGLGTFVASLSLTWIGRQMDRHGSRRVGSMILLAFAGVLMGLSAFINGPVTLLIAFFLIRFLGQGSLGLISTTAIAQWWRLRRGWVVGLAVVGFSLWQTMYLGLLQGFINDFGWRTTWVILGLMVGGAVLPLWWLFMRDKPEQFGLLPDGVLTPVTDPETAGESSLPVEDNWRLGEAMQTVIFWVFVAGRVLPAAFTTGLIFHQISLFAELGYSAEVVTQTYGLLAMVSALSTLVTGRVINRIPRPSYVMAFQMAALIGAMLLAMSMREAWLLWLYATLVGIVMGVGGTFDGTVWADLYGRANLGTIRGFVSTTLVAGTSVGPILFGLSFDNLATYDAALWFGIALSAVPTLMCFFLTQPRRRVSVA